MPDIPATKPSRRLKVVQRRLVWVIERIVSDQGGKVDARVWDSLTKAKKELNFSIVLQKGLEGKVSEPFKLT